MLHITHAETNFKREPLLHPFGFKGGALTEIWQCACTLTDESGLKGTGIGCQNVLWSDARVFSSGSPAAGAGMMYAITDFAARLLTGRSFRDPFEALDAILPDCLRYGRAVTRREDLRTTFVLNALVPVDMALWQVYERQMGHRGFDAVTPDQARTYLAGRYDRLQIIPLISYGVSVAEAKAMAEEGYFFLKIKLGSDPERDGDQDKMLAWDMRRIREIHEAVKDIPTPWTSNGHIAYYFDCNGRYDSVDRVKRLLEYADSIGALERTIILEEPLEESDLSPVGDLSVMVAADESAHSPEDVRERLALGYRAIALKPIAKTLSVTFRMIEEAGKAGASFFCADLTVGPLQADVNKCFAARLKCLPGLKLPVMESNGWQNYKNWDLMRAALPDPGAPWTKMAGGGVPLDARFYDASACIFEDLPVYEGIAEGRLV
ncbi:MAG: mandelate racemase/muconate lactonizing enzyme family protein [Clostridia bacterium]|nr:mandelate racemase/muconate lactonizing enzyme family protein [Clostridia bacterium]